MIAAAVSLSWLAMWLRRRKFVADGRSKRNPNPVTTTL